MTEALLMASIGTVLVDIFETPPSSTGTCHSKGSTPTPRPAPTTGTAPEPKTIAEARVVGGGALYALIGARMWIQPEWLRTIVVAGPELSSQDTTGCSGLDSSDCLGSPDGRDELGEDTESHPLDSVGDPPKLVTNNTEDDGALDTFPPDLAAQIRHFGDMWIFERGPGLRPISSRIGYDGEVRTYTPLVKPPIRSATSIAASPLKGVQYLHVAPPYGPSELLAFVEELEAFQHEVNGERNEGSGLPWRPKIVFEPAPVHCHPGERASLERVLGKVDVLTPNHEELLAFYGQPCPPTDQCRQAVENAIQHLLDIGVGPAGGGIVVVRCGALGACVATRAGGVAWVPAYFGEGEARRVRDVTGAGNAFVGGYVAGLALTGDAYDAALYATVSASFVVEQRGLPTLDLLHPGELWNGESPSHRLQLLRERLKAEAL